MFEIRIQSKGGSPGRHHRHTPRVHGLLPKPMQQCSTNASLSVTLHSHTRTRRRRMAPGSSNVSHICKSLGNDGAEKFIAKLHTTRHVPARVQHSEKHNRKEERTNTKKHTVPHSQGMDLLGKISPLFSSTYPHPFVFTASVLRLH